MFPVFGVRVLVKFHRTCVHIILSGVANFWEIAAHSVDHMFYLYFDIFVMLAIFSILRAGFGF